MPGRLMPSWAWWVPWAVAAVAFAWAMYAGRPSSPAPAPAAISTPAVVFERFTAWAACVRACDARLSDEQCVEHD